MDTATSALARAEDYLWRNARLIDRRRYEYHFRGGSPDLVWAALRGYCNADGGFGQALEPDLRSPEAQPVFQEVGLRLMAEVGPEEAILAGLRRYLPAITTADGGLPAVLPSAVKYPRAPWWQPQEPLAGGLMPTGAVAGYLHRLGVRDPWLDRATDFCWQAFEEGEPDEAHDLLFGLVFLENAPDTARARKAFAAVGERILARGLVALDPEAEGYVQKPLEWAPRPQSWCRELFDDAVIEAHLEALLARQQADGGWPITWPAVSPACECEWRGCLTVDALLTLRAYGRV